MLFVPVTPGPERTSWRAEGRQEAVIFYSAGGAGALIFSQRARTHARPFCRCRSHAHGQFAAGKDMRKELLMSRCAPVKAQEHSRARRKLDGSGRVASAKNVMVCHIIWILRHLQ